MLPIASPAYGMGRDTLRHASQRYEPLTRMASMTTTRSNCYAVWITIGFFEVEDFDQSSSTDSTILARFGSGAGTLAVARTDPLFLRVYPDSVKFGREIGLDTGEVRRRRGFYIVDRSLPAGFEPGVDNNVENVIRLRRQIE